MIKTAIATVIAAVLFLVGHPGGPEAEHIAMVVVHHLPVGK